MIVILEGSDCTGKTTFANELSKKTGFEIVKGSSFEISKLGADGMYRYMMTLLDRDNIIIDRFMHSNLVYAPLYNYPMMQSAHYLHLTSEINKKALVVYLNAHPRIIAERMESRGDDMIESSEINSILEKYQEELNGIFMPKVMLSLNTSDLNFNIATEMVKDIISQDMTKTCIKLQ